MTLFDPGPAQPKEQLSTDARRTIRNNNAIARGMHPVTKVRLLNNGHTCGDCAHRGMQGGVAGRFHKCGARGGLYVTGGPATDIRLKWPACALWEEA